MGRAWKLGANVSTDEIIPGRYNVTTDRSQLAAHCLCEARPDFVVGVQPGDFIVAGRNFGCGSSREHAPVAIRSAGVRAVVAESFARIFYRNAINIGLPILICPGVSDQISDGDQVEVDFQAGMVTNLSSGARLQADPLPEFVLKIAEAGSIVEYVKRHGWEGLE